MVHEEDGCVVLDLAMRIKAPNGQEIDLAEIKGIIFGLKQRGFDIRKVSYDQFQSASSIQELQKQGFNAERFSLDRDLAGYSTLKNVLYEKKMKMYRYEPLLEELRRLEFIEGKKVDHPAVNGGSKDVADAVAGAVYHCVTDQNEILFWFAGSTPQKPVTVEKLVRYGEYNGRMPI